MRQEDSVCITMSPLRLGIFSRITGSRKSLFLIGMAAAAHRGLDIVYLKTCICTIRRNGRGADFSFLYVEFSLGMYIMETGHRRPSSMIQMLSTVQSTASITAPFTLETLWQLHIQLSEKVWDVEGNYASHVSWKRFLVYIISTHNILTCLVLEQSIFHGTRVGWAIQSTSTRSTRSSCRSSTSSRQTLFWSAQDLTLPKVMLSKSCELNVIETHVVSLYVSYVTNLPFCI